MFKGVHDIFALVIIFLGFDWQPKIIIIGLFEATKNYRTNIGQQSNKIAWLTRVNKPNHCLC
jgi:hypothetical protein